MKLSNEKPPNYEEIIKVFNLGKEKVLFTYGDTIYNPFGGTLTDDLMEHELTHIRQQKGDDAVAKIWWMRYIADTDFRFEQEVEAYANQYDYLCKMIKDRNRRFKILLNIAKILAGPIYGGIGSADKYLQMLRSKVKCK